MELTALPSSGNKNTWEICEGAFWFVAWVFRIFLCTGHRNFVDRFIRYCTVSIDKKHFKIMLSMHRKIPQILIARLSFGAE
jgi:hypothetical protein